MFQFTLRSAALLAVLSFLGACATAQTSTQTPTAEKPAPKRLEIREYEVEAPQVFEETALALWDGRPSLGGIWVAHPLAASPERVKITNLRNNMEMTGALFRRDASFAGPPFQLSSDAAQALGIEPGSPVQLEVVALRKELKTEEVEQPAPPPVAEPAPATDMAAKADAATPATEPESKAAETDIEAIADAALAKVEAATPPAPPKPDIVLPDPAPKPKFALSKPYIQVGTFGVVSNATELVKRLNSRGLSAQTRAITVRGKSYQRVLVGPFKDATSFDKALTEIRRMGFADALAVKG